MTKIYLLTSIVIVSAIIVICAISECNGVISDKRLCYDPECSEPVSLARTLIRYNSIEPNILSFPSNIEIIIFSKEAGKRQDLWGAQVHGKRGYVPKTLVREYKTLKSKLTHEVPTEFVPKEVNTTDEVKVDVPSKADGSELDVEANSTIGESQSLKEIEKVENEVNNGTLHESETSKEPEKNLEPETTSDNLPPAIDSSDSSAEESIGQKPEELLEGVQSVTPSFEVIDGTAIPVLHDEIPIKPSYSTPIIAATGTPDEEPILSVHPSLPATVRPLISSFLSSGSQTIVEDNPNTKSDVIAKTQTDKTDSEKQPQPVENSVRDSEIDKLEVDKEITIEDVSENEILGNNNLARDAETPEITQPAENSIENSKKIVNDAENDKNNKVEPSQDESDRRSGKDEKEEILPEVEAAGNSANDTLQEKLDPVDNFTENLGSENEIVNTNESVEEVVQTNLDSNAIQEESNENVSEIIGDKNEIEGTIQVQEIRDSREQTEHSSDENVNTTGNDGVDGSNNVEDKIMLTRADIPLSSETVEKNDSQLIVNDGVIDYNENLTVYAMDDVREEARVEDNSENTSQEEIVDTYYPFNILNPGSEEMTTEFYPELGEERPTTSRSLLTVEGGLQYDDNQLSTKTFDIDQHGSSEVQTSQEYENETHNEANVLEETSESETVEKSIENTSFAEHLNIQVAPAEVCDINSDCTDINKDGAALNEQQDAEGEVEDREDEGSYPTIFEQHNYLETLLYLSITAFTTLLFSLGYYYIENQRRDKELVAKINVLEKELLVTTKESMMLNEGLKTTKHKLDSIEDESFGSNEMVLSLKSELEAAQITKGELEDQIITLEKELESASEAGLELERMLREFLASQSDENPLAQSVEDLQTRLNAQQATNESLTNSLNLKSQENEALTSELAFTQERCQQLEVEITRLSGELKTQSNLKNNADKEFSAKIMQLNKQISKLSGERAGFITQLTTKEMALNDLSEVVKQQNTDSFDFEKFYDVSHVKAVAEQLTKERDELKIKLIEVEGAYQLLEEHMKLIKEEIASVTEQYELAERDKTEAQTRLEVLSNYFKEKESQLQKELGMQEAMWVQKQGEVTSTVDRIQTMQNEIQNYRQQIETLKREILDQEREYKSQIAALETKSHEQWVIARQSERRLEESKAEASQLRNRLTMVEKSINEVDPDSKLHRLETNGETASSPQLFMGAETSSSPILFTGSSGVPPLPPTYMYGAPLPPPFIPPPPHSGGGPMYDISRRPPPLGGRLSSPPPIPPLHHPPGRYEDASSPPPPLSPPLHPPYNHRSPPPFSNERIHPHLNPPPPFLPPLGTSHSWGDEPLPPLRNPVFHPHQREQRLRNHKGSLHSSGDSLDKTNHTGKS